MMTEWRVCVCTVPLCKRRWGSSTAEKKKKPSGEAAWQKSPRPPPLAPYFSLVFVTMLIKASSISSRSPCQTAAFPSRASSLSSSKIFGVNVPKTKNHVHSFTVQNPSHCCGIVADQSLTMPHREYQCPENISMSDL